VEFVASLNSKKSGLFHLCAETGQRRQFTNLKPGYSIESFDVSPDGRQVLFDRVRQNSDIVLIDLARK